jgi:large conductance mechanosensitive channel
MYCFCPGKVRAQRQKERKSKMEKEKPKGKTGKLKEKAAKAHGMLTEFRDFLKEYKIIGIAAGLVIGSAVTALVQSIVVGLITPALQLLIPSEALKTLAFQFNGSVFQVGMVISAVINFLIIALLFFIFLKLFLKKEKVEKI